MSLGQPERSLLPNRRVLTQQMVAGERNSLEAMLAISILFKKYTDETKSTDSVIWPAFNVHVVLKFRP